MDYSILTIGDPNAPLPDFGFIGNPFYLYFIAVFAAAIVVALYAGKNRLVVRRTQSELTLAGAKRIAKHTLNKEQLTYARLIAQRVDADDAKSAALLCLAVERGVSPQALADGGIGRDAGIAALMLARRPGESEQARWERVQGHPAAEPVFHAQARYTADCASQQAAAYWHAYMAQYNQAMSTQPGGWLAGYTHPTDAHPENQQGSLGSEPSATPEAQPGKDGDGTPY